MWRRLTFLLVLGLTACDGTRPQPTPTGPTFATPAAPAPPAPAVPVPPPVGVNGSVSDTAWRPVEGATVEVLDGPHAGSTTTTNDSGAFSFRFEGIDGTTTFRAAKAGHVPKTATGREPGCASCYRFVSFVLELDVPPLDLAGDYTLTFVADAICAARLPDEARTRSYSATIARDQTLSWLFQVSVLGASVLHGYDWEGMSISVAGDHIAMAVGNAHGSPGLVEEVAAGRYVGFDGFASASVGTPSASTVSTSFEGLIESCQLPPGSPSPAAGRPYTCANAQPGARVQCTSKNHQFTMTRR